MKCPICGKEFYPNTYNQKYCSKKCCSKFHDKKRNELVKSNKLCECGCGNYTNAYRGKTRRYIHGHFKNHENSLKAIKVAAEAHRLKIDWQKIIPLYTEKQLTYTEIAKQLNCNPSTVKRNLNKLGIETRGIKGSYINKLGYEASTLTGKLIHRELMEKHLGRPLLTNEHVHHKNGIRDDNRLDNLEVVAKSKHHKKWAELLRENLRLKAEVELLKTK